jgi:hypothetical protein
MCQFSDGPEYFYQCRTITEWHFTYQYRAKTFSARLSFECLFVSVFIAKGHFMKRISALRINEHQQFGTMTLPLNDICLNDIFLP